VRVANLPPETPNGVLREVLNTYGDIRRITDENWSNKLRYRTESGIRLVEIHLRKHIPSHMSLVVTRLLISYEGQPATCYGCGGPGHQYTDCPTRRKQSNMTAGQTPRTWADIVQGGEESGTIIDSQQILPGDRPNTDTDRTVHPACAQTHPAHHTGRRQCRP
jgi:hypothetical protein